MRNELTGFGGLVERNEHDPGRCTGRTQKKPPGRRSLNRSLTLLNLRRFEESLTDHDKYLKFDPYNADMWYEKGLVLNVLERYPSPACDQQSYQLQSESRYGRQKCSMIKTNWQD